MSRKSAQGALETATLETATPKLFADSISRLAAKSLVVPAWGTGTVSGGRQSCRGRPLKHRAASGPAICRDVLEGVELRFVAAPCLLAPEFLGVGIVDQQAVEFLCRFSGLLQAQFRLNAQAEVGALLGVGAV